MFVARCVGCIVCSKGRISLDDDKPPEQPAPETLVTTTERAVDNTYFSVRKLGKATEDVDNVKNDDDPLYESICGETSSPDLTPEPRLVASYKNLCDPQLGESSSL